MNKINVGMVCVLVLGAAASGYLLMMKPDLLSNVNDGMTVGTMGGRSWKPIITGDANPGGDNSGFMYFMVYPHQADPGTAYASNLSNATAYEFSDSLNTEMTGETPHSTTFDFVLKFRVNDTVGYNVSGSCWEDSWVRANITCDFDFAGDIAADTAMTIVQIATSTDFAWYHAYINNGAVGYQITHNEKFNVTSVKASGYY